MPMLICGILALGIIFTAIPTYKSYVKNKDNKKEAIRKTVAITIYGVAATLALAIVANFLSDCIKSKDERITNSDVHSIGNNFNNEDSNNTNISIDGVSSNIKDFSSQDKDISKDEGESDLEQSSVDKRISLYETHSPNDYVYSVNVNDWEPNSDIGINGVMYDGGMKVELSNLFINMGSNIEHKLISRLTLQFPLEAHSFSGTFVLDKSMFGSKSYGTVRIISDGIEVFSTGEINGNTTGSFPFEINVPATKVIIIEADVALIGSNFIYGIVDSKE